MRPSHHARTLFAATVFAAYLATAAYAQQVGAAPALAYDAETRGPAPIPPSERGLQTVVAEPWFQVSDMGLVLEGPAFDRDGNLLFCDVSGRRVLRLTPDKRLSTVVSLDRLGPGGLAVHKDGRIFIAAIDLIRGVGSVVAVKPDGSGMQPILPQEAGYMPNDLVFDAQGGFYFTDFRGTSTDPKGGVYYVSPDFRMITPVLPHLAMANGVALSPAGKELWATEFSRDLLHRVELADATAATPYGTAVAYHFTGPAPDSMRADIDGNLYVAMYGQGRVLVFNRNGIPIGQVLLPGREEGHNQARHRRPLYRDERCGRRTRCHHLSCPCVHACSAALLAPVNCFRTDAGCEVADFAPGDRTTAAGGSSFLRPTTPRVLQQEMKDQNP